MFNLSTHAMVAYPPTVTDPRPHRVGEWVCHTASLGAAGGNKTVSLTVFGLRRLTHNQRRYRQNLTNTHKTRKQTLVSVNLRLYLFMFEFLHAKR